MQNQLLLEAGISVGSNIDLGSLIARLEVLMQRFETLTEQHDHAAVKKLSASHSTLYIDEQQQALFWQQQKVELTLAQYWIAKTLVNNPGQAKTASQLMRAANLYVEPNTIAAHIKTIRQRFRAIDPDFNNIRTERGIGYRWVND